MVHSAPLAPCFVQMQSQSYPYAYARLYTPMNTLKKLRRQAIGQTLFQEHSLASALNRLRYVQADPIRAPARSQDLVLRHRVLGYRVGDLDEHYPSLSIEEDVLHNYGFLTPELQAHVHPRKPRSCKEPKDIDLYEAVYGFVVQNGPTHPKTVAQQLGSHRVESGWGSMSAATTRMLENLHFEGRLRVAKRVNGIKVFEASTPPAQVERPEWKAQRLVETLVSLYGPISSRSLKALVRMLNYGAPHLKSELKRAFENGEGHATETWDGQTYVYPQSDTTEIPDAKVRFLSPFDPIVWDRFRFQQLWDWTYRLEAYIPADKRRLGYYALPILWEDDVVGCVNIRVEGKTLGYDTHYPNKPERLLGKTYQTAFLEELDALAHFLRL